MTDFAIWWLSQTSCELLDARGGLPTDLPKYIREQYNSRYGRNGRGRLWVAKQLDLPDDFGIEWPDSSLAVTLAEDYGGIVVRAEDVATLPPIGIITNLALGRL